MRSRLTRSIAAMLLCAVAGVVAASVPVAAAGAPTAVILPRATNSVLTCELGKRFKLSGSQSIDPDGGPLTYEWYASLGGEVGEDPARFSFDCDFPGSNDVSLTVTNAAGLQDTVAISVVSNGAPTALVSPPGTPVSHDVYVQVGSKIRLDAGVSTDPEGGPLTYDWYFPDGTGPVKFPPNDFSSSYLDVACDTEEGVAMAVTVTDDHGLSDNYGLVLECLELPSAAFTPTPAPSGRRTPVALGSEITFEQTAYSVTRDWRTTGTSGIAGTGVTFTRKFDQLGEVGVELIAANGVGQDKVWSGFTVMGLPTVAVSPAPANEPDRMKVELGSTVTFDGSGSTSPGGGTLQYQWRTTGTPGVVGDQVRFGRRFDQVGNFGVELTVVNELGQTAKRWVGVTVVKSVPPVVAVSPAPPNPRDRMTVRLGDLVTFNGAASRDPDGGSLTFSWRTTGVRGVVWTEGSYQRRFDQLGNFGVELTVTDDEGQTAKRWVGVTVVR